MSFLRPSLTVDGVDLWFLELDRPTQFHDTTRPWLSEREIARGERFAFPELKSRYLASRALLRGVLAERLGVAPALISFDEEPGEKPRLAYPVMPHVSFNLSHADGLMCLAVAEGREVGVDVERIRGDIELGSLAAQCLGPREMERWLGVGDSRRRYDFYRLWTAKEAILKAHGVGLRYEMRDLEVSFSPHPEAKCLTGENFASGYEIQELTAPSGFVANLAVAL